MPYKIVKKSGGYFVKTKSGPHRGRLHSKRPLSEYMAKRQMRALYASENGYSLKKKNSLSGGGQKWISSVHLKRGSFTKEAEKHKMKPEQFANTVLKNPNNYDLKTRRRAQFLVNIRPHKVIGGDEREEDYPDEMNFLPPDHYNENDIIQQRKIMPRSIKKNNKK